MKILKLQPFIIKKLILITDLMEWILVLIYKKIKFLKSRRAFIIQNYLNLIESKIPIIET